MLTLATAAKEPEKSFSWSIDLQSFLRPDPSHDQTNRRKRNRRNIPIGIEDYRFAAEFTGKQSGERPGRSTC